MKDAVHSLKTMTAEKTSLHQQLLEADQMQKKLRNQIREADQTQEKLRDQIREADQTQKNLRDQTRAFKEEISFLRRGQEEFKDKAEIKEEALKTLEVKYRLAEKRISGLIDTTNEQQRVLGSRILALEDQLSAATFSLEQSRTELINVENELSSATNQLSELDREHDKLQREHAELLIAYKRLKGKGNSASDRSSLKGIGRGFATLVMAPCNYFRIVPQTCEMADAIESKNGCSQLSVIMAFPLLVWDTIPTIADIADGVADIVSLGGYGDWLYSEEGFKGNSPWWYERSNKGFPWIQK